MASQSTDRVLYQQIHTNTSPPTDGCSHRGTLGVRKTDGTLWWYTAAGWALLLSQGQTLATDAEIAAAVAAATALLQAEIDADVAAAVADEQFIFGIPIGTLTSNTSVFYVHPTGAHDYEIIGLSLVSYVDLTQTLTVTLGIDGTSVKEGANPISIQIAAGAGVGADVSALADADNLLTAGAKIKADTVTTNATDGLAMLYICCKRA